MESETLYWDKLKEVQKYISLLESTINRLESKRNATDMPREALLSKIKSLRALILNTSKRMKLINLKKCKQVLMKLCSKVEKADILPTLIKLKDPQNAPLSEPIEPAETAVSDGVGSMTGMDLETAVSDGVGSMTGMDLETADSVLEFETRLPISNQTLIVPAVTQLTPAPISVLITSESVSKVISASISTDSTIASVQGLSNTDLVEPRALSESHTALLEIWRAKVKSVSKKSSALSATVPSPTNAATSQPKTLTSLVCRATEDQATTFTPSFYAEKIYDDLSPSESTNASLADDVNSKHLFQGKTPIQLFSNPSPSGSHKKVTNNKRVLQLFQRQSPNRSPRWPRSRFLSSLSIKRNQESYSEFCLHGSYLPSSSKAMGYIHKRLGDNKDEGNRFNSAFPNTIMKCDEKEVDIDQSREVHQWIVEMKRTLANEDASHILKLQREINKKKRVKNYMEDGELCSDSEVAKNIYGNLIIEIKKEQELPDSKSDKDYSLPVEKDISCKTTENGMSKIEISLNISDNVNGSDESDNKEAHGQAGPKSSSNVMLSNGNIFTQIDAEKKEVKLQSSQIRDNLSLTTGSNKYSSIHLDEKIEIFEAILPNDSNALCNKETIKDLQKLENGPFIPEHLRESSKDKTADSTSIISEKDTLQALDNEVKGENLGLTDLAAVNSNSIAKLKKKIIPETPLLHQDMDKKRISLEEYKEKVGLMLLPPSILSPPHSNQIQPQSSLPPSRMNHEEHATTISNIIANPETNLYLKPESKKKPTSFLEHVETDTGPKSPKLGYAFPEDFAEPVIISVDSVAEGSENEPSLVSQKISNTVTSSTTSMVHDVDMRVPFPNQVNRIPHASPFSPPHLRLALPNIGTTNRPLPIPQVPTIKPNLSFGYHTTGNNEGDVQGHAQMHMCPNIMSDNVASHFTRQKFSIPIATMNKFNVSFPVSKNYKGKNPKPLLGYTNVLSSTTTAPECKQVRVQDAMRCRTQSRLINHDIHCVRNIHQSSDGIAYRSYDHSSSMSTDYDNHYNLATHSRKSVCRDIKDNLPFYREHSVGHSIANCYSPFGNNKQDCVSQSPMDRKIRDRNGNFMRERYGGCFDMDFRRLMDRSSVGHQDSSAKNPVPRICETKLKPKNDNLHVRRSVNSKDAIESRVYRQRKDLRRSHLEKFEYESNIKQSKQYKNLSSIDSSKNRTKKDSYQSKISKSSSSNLSPGLRSPGKFSEQRSSRGWTQDNQNNKADECPDSSYYSKNSIKEGPCPIFTNDNVTRFLLGQSRGVHNYKIPKIKRNSDEKHISTDIKIEKTLSHVGLVSPNIGTTNTTLLIPQVATKQSKLSLGRLTPGHSMGDGCNNTPMHVKPNIISRSYLTKSVVQKPIATMNKFNVNFPLSTNYKGHILKPLLGYTNVLSPSTTDPSEPKQIWVQGDSLKSAKMNNVLNESSPAGASPSAENVETQRKKSVEKLSSSDDQEIDILSSILYLLKDKTKIMQLLSLLDDNKETEKIKKKLSKLVEIESDDEDSTKDTGNKKVGKSEDLVKSDSAVPTKKQSVIKRKQTTKKDVKLRAKTNVATKPKLVAKIITSAKKRSPNPFTPANELPGSGKKRRDKFQKLEKVITDSKEMLSLTSIQNCGLQKMTNVDVTPSSERLQPKCKKQKIVPTEKVKAQPKVASLAQTHHTMPCVVTKKASIVTPLGDINESELLKPVQEIKELLTKLKKVSKDHKVTKPLRTSTKMSPVGKAKKKPEPKQRGLGVLMNEEIVTRKEVISKVFETTEKCSEMQTKENVKIEATTAQKILIDKPLVRDVIIPTKIKPGPKSKKILSLKKLIQQNAEDQSSQLIKIMDDLIGMTAKADNVEETAKPMKNGSFHSAELLIGKHSPKHPNKTTKESSISHPDKEVPDSEHPSMDLPNYTSDFRSRKCESAEVWKENEAPSVQHSASKQNTMSCCNEHTEGSPEFRSADFIQCIKKETNTDQQMEISIEEFNSDSYLVPVALNNFVRNQEDLPQKLSVACPTSGAPTSSNMGPVTKGSTDAASEVAPTPGLNQTSYNTVKPLSHLISQPITELSANLLIDASQTAEAAEPLFLQLRKENVVSLKMAARKKSSVSDKGKSVQSSSSTDKRELGNAVKHYSPNTGSVNIKPVTVAISKAHSPGKVLNKDTSDKLAILPRDSPNSRTGPAAKDSVSSEIPSQLLHNKGKDTISKIISAIAQSKQPLILQRMLVDSKILHLYKCGDFYCSYTTSSAYAFTSHLKEHRKKRAPSSVGTTGETRCVYCSYENVSVTDLVRHVLEEHGHCTHACVYCLYTATAGSLVELHQTKMHHQSRQIVLKLSPVTSHSHRESVKLMRPRNEVILPYLCKQCDTCNYKFYTSAGFISHLELHSSDASFKCAYCPDTFVRIVDLMRHLREHGLCLYQCPYCLHGAISEIEMLNHMAECHPNRWTVAHMRYIIEKVSEGPELVKYKTLPLVNLDKTGDASEYSEYAPEEDPIKEVANLNRQRAVLQPAPVAELLTQQKTVPKSSQQGDTAKHVPVESSGAKETTEKKESNAVLIIAEDVPKNVEEEKDTVAPLESEEPCQGDVICLDSDDDDIVISNIPTQETRKSTEASVPQTKEIRKMRFSSETWQAHNVTADDLDRALTCTDKKDTNIIIKSKEVPLRLSSPRRAPTKTKKITFGPEDIDELPLNPILDEIVYCSKCTFGTKVRSNMLRHLQLHVSGFAVPFFDSINIVPHLETNEKHFHKMANHSLSTHDKSASKEKQDSRKVMDPSFYPKFVPDNERYVCGALGCQYISLSPMTLKQHWETLHPGVSSYKCVHCPSDQHLDISRPLTTAPIVTNLKMRDVKLYACSECKYYHHQKHLVERHLSNQHRRVPKASVCLIREVEDDVVKEKPAPVEKPNVQPTMDLKPWKWNICNFKTLLRSDIIMHCPQKHSLELECKCSICSFTNCNSHNVIHHKGKPEKTGIKVYDKDEGTGNDDTSYTPNWWNQNKRPCVFTNGSSDFVNQSGLQRKKMKVDENNFSDEVDKDVFNRVLGISQGSSHDHHIDERMVDLNIVNTEESTEGYNHSKSFVGYGGMKGPSFLCPLCTNHATFDIEDMKTHLYEELNYRKWCCTVCSFKAFDMSLCQQHSIIAHTHYHTPQELPADTAIEKWVDSVITHQLGIIIAKSKETRNDVPSEKPPVVAPEFLTQANLPEISDEPSNTSMEDEYILSDLAPNSLLPGILKADSPQGSAAFDSPILKRLLMLYNRIT